MSTFQPGDLLCDRFQITRFIARGGMGEVYEAQDSELHERIALKTIRPDIATDERANQRFRREVQLARRITHPNICRIFDLFQHQPATPASAEPVTFLTMELLDGETLTQRLDCSGPFPVEQALPIIVQMAAALSAAHAAGVVHRDLKCKNVMLLAPRVPGEPIRAVVTDFGLASLVAPDTGMTAATTMWSTTGEIAGTPDYMAPEQVEGGPVTPATDVYALGIVLYEMVTGILPFAADTPMAAALRRVTSPPRPPREIAGDLPPSWNSVIMQCLARHPADRFPDAASVAEALGSSWELPVPRPGFRRVAAAAIAGAALAAALGIWVWHSRTAEQDAARNRDFSASLPQENITSAGTAVPMPRPSVAVLGFRNLTERADVQWLSTAFAEMLTTELGAEESVRTIPGESVGRMKVELNLPDVDAYSAETLARIGENLSSDLIVFGSYVTVGSGDAATIRLDLRVQDVRSSEGISLVTERGTAGELLDLVSRAGQRLRERLDVTAPSAPADAAMLRASQPASPEAARHYAEGLASLRRFDALVARDRFEEAVRLDPMFPLAHSALASAWAALGYDTRAEASALRAFELSTRLPRQERLIVEGTYHEMAREMKEAIATWQTLSTFFPDDVEHVLRLTGAQTAAGSPREGLATVERFRARFPSVRDPRLDLATAEAADTLSDFGRAREAARAAAAAASRQGARLLVAAAKLREGGAAFRQGELDAAGRLFEEARLLYEASGDRAGVARSLNNLASVVAARDPARSVAVYRQGLAIARSVGDQDQVARFLNNLAIQERRGGNLSGSLELNQLSLAIRREIGDRVNAAISLNNIGNVLLDMGDLADASKHYDESAAMSRETGDRLGLARALFNASEATRMQAQLERARTLGAEALTIRQEIKDAAGVASSLHGMGTTRLIEGDLAGARRSLTEALEMDRKLQRQPSIAFSLHELGNLALVEGDFNAARRLYQESLSLRMKLGETLTAAESRSALSRLAIEERRFDQAERFAREAITVFAGQRARDSEATARATLALSLAGQGRVEQARSEARQALALTQRTQNVLARLSVTIAAATVDGATNAGPAMKILESARAEALEHGTPQFELEARRAMIGLTPQPSPAFTAQMASLREDARARGYLLYGR